MRQIIIRAAVSLLGLAALGQAQAADQIPMRKPGLWEMSSELSLMPGQKMILRQCIDKDTDTNMMSQAGTELKECSPPSISRSGDQMVVESTCRVEGSTAVTRGVFSGDYQSSYRGDVLTRFTPPLRGMAETRVAIQARWAGPCAPGQKPGSTEMQMPGLGNINLGEMMKNLPKMQAR